METFARLIRGIRRSRGKSQLALATDAGVSTRHLSYIENGRARPSRDMVVLLADALDVPLRERNQLLVAAGLAPEYSEHALDADEMRQAREALDLILRGHEPLPAVCFDRAGDVVMANEPYLAFARALGAAPEGATAYAILPSPRLNMVRTLLSRPEPRHAIRNFDEVAGAVIARARRELVRRGDRILRAELEHLVQSSGVPEHVVAGSPRLMLAIELVLGEDTVRFVSTLATLGTTFDVTLDELRIEFYHPADEHAGALFRAASSPRPAPARSRL
jgi:transcriptional regulator with XRE-family HTH domain